MSRAELPKISCASARRRMGFCTRGSTRARSSITSDVDRTCPYASRTRTPRRWNAEMGPPTPRAACESPSFSPARAPRIVSAEIPARSPAKVSSWNCVVVTPASRAPCRSAAASPSKACAKASAPAVIAARPATTPREMRVKMRPNSAALSPLSPRRAASLSKPGTARESCAWSFCPSARSKPTFTASTRSRRSLVPFSTASRSTRPCSVGNARTFAAAPSTFFTTPASWVSSRVIPNSANTLRRASDIAQSSRSASSRARASASSIASSTTFASYTSTTDHCVRIVWRESE